MSESLITKNAIAYGLKELTRKKSFDKITISDITNICGLNRQTFYYHFQDKYELVDWIYYNETVSIIIKDLTFDNWSQKVKEMLTKMKAEDYFYENTLKCSVENGFREYLFRVCCELFSDIIAGIAVDEAVSKEDIHFMAEFFSFGIVGMIITWAQKGMKETPEYITNQLEKLAYGTKKFAAARYLQTNIE
jgi:probable dihydroxyacetone kinase regulator